VTEAVRKLIAAYPKLTAKQIHEGLIKQGIKVSLALVNKVKYTKSNPQRGQTKRKQTDRKTAAAPASAQRRFVATGERSGRRTWRY
jgi:hypothetical protein